MKFANEADPTEIPLPDGSALPDAAMTPAPPPGLIGIHMPFPAHMLRTFLLLYFLCQIKTKKRNSTKTIFVFFSPRSTTFWWYTEAHRNNAKEIRASAGATSGHATCVER